MNPQYSASVRTFRTSISARADPLNWRQSGREPFDPPKSHPLPYLVMMTLVPAAFPFGLPLS